jgi:large subunit ribosomal protein L29
MKITEIRDLTVEELRQQVEEARKELFSARIKLSMQQLNNTAQLRMLKHRIAQLKTVLREKEPACKTGGQKK